jgi:hypothetical protein
MFHLSPRAKKVDAFLTGRCPDLTQLFRIEPRDPSAHRRLAQAHVTTKLTDRYAALYRYWICAPGFS